jgi:glycosyltransferase involved in cell wall biosynthesis
MTDIVVDTLNRLPLLQRSLESIFERTVTPYRLHVIDDASTEGNAEYLRGLHEAGKLASVTLREKRLGIPANWNQAARTGDSEIVVYCNGDVLCPKVSPDWLLRGLGALDRYADLGAVSLNSPMCTANGGWKVVERRKGVVIADRVPSFYLFVRRALMQDIVIPDVGGKLEEIPIVPEYTAIDRAWSRAVQRRGYKVGYLAKTYCEHIGVHSVRNGRDLSQWAVPVVDAETLEPPREYAG